MKAKLVLLQQIEMNTILSFSEMFRNQALI